MVAHLASRAVGAEPDEIGPREMARLSRQRRRGGRGNLGKGKPRGGSELGKPQVDKLAERWCLRSKCERALIFKVPRSTVNNELNVRISAGRLIDERQTYTSRTTRNRKMMDGWPSGGISQTEVWSRKDGKNDHKQPRW